LLSEAGKPASTVGILLLNVPQILHSSATRATHCALLLFHSLLLWDCVLYSFSILRISRFIPITLPTFGKYVSRHHVSPFNSSLHPSLLLLLFFLLGQSSFSITHLIFVPGSPVSPPRSQYMTNRAPTHLISYKLQSLRQSHHILCKISSGVVVLCVEVHACSMQQNSRGLYHLICWYDLQAADFPHGQPHFSLDAFLKYEEVVTLSEGGG
jgi:hypothetical protein